MAASEGKPGADSTRVCWVRVEMNGRAVWVSRWLGPCGTHVRVTATPNEGQWLTPMGHAERREGQGLHNTGNAACGGCVIYQKTLQRGERCFAAPWGRGSVTGRGTQGGPLYHPQIGGGGRADSRGAHRAILCPRGPPGLRRGQRRACALHSIPAPRPPILSANLVRLIVARDLSWSLEFCPCPTSTTPLSWK